MKTHQDYQTFKRDVITTIKCISNFLGKNSDGLYSQNKNAILNLFKKTEFKKEDIILRLTVIDSMYTTGINKNNYYAIPHIADRILECTPNADKRKLFDILYDYTNNPDGNELNKIFEARYGLRKDKSPGSTAKSLLSKYFYYHTLDCSKDFCFPIFDSLARKMLVKINDMPFFDSGLDMPKSKWNNGSISMKEFIKALNEIKNKLGINSYGDFDTYLWRIGKLCQQEPNYNFDLCKDDFKNVTVSWETNKIKLCTNEPFNDDNVNKYYEELINHINKYYL